MNNLHWRKATASGGGGTNCVEVAQAADGEILVRNSNRPDLGVISFTRDEIQAWIAGCKAGEFDDI